MSQKFRKSSTFLEQDDQFEILINVKQTCIIAKFWNSHFLAHNTMFYSEHDLTQNTDSYHVQVISKKL
jgi:hypothetical protein